MSVFISSFQSYGHPAITTILSNMLSRFIRSPMYLCFRPQAPWLAACKFYPHQLVKISIRSSGHYFSRFISLAKTLHGFVFLQRPFFSRTASHIPLFIFFFFLAAPSFFCCSSIFHHGSRLSRRSSSILDPSLSNFSNNLSDCTVYTLSMPYLVR